MGVERCRFQNQELSRKVRNTDTSQHNKNIKQNLSLNSILEEHTACLDFYPDDGYSTFVQNVGIHLPYNTVSYHREPQYKILDDFKHFFIALFNLLDVKFDHRANC